MSTKENSVVGELDQRLLKVLQQSPAGETVDQLSRVLKVPVPELMTAIQILHDAKHVSLKRGTIWQATGKLYFRSTPPSIMPSYREKHLESPQAGATNPFRVAHRPKVDIASSRWADFRRLCHYYAECVRLEQSTRVSAYADQEGKRFISVPMSLDWRAISGGQTVALAMRPEWRDFVRVLRSERGTSSLYLGTPVDVFLGKDRTTGEPYRIVSPSFVIAIEAGFQEGTIFLKPKAAVALNHGWLEGRFRNPEDRRLFMELCGFERNQVEDAGGADAGQRGEGSVLPSVPELTEVLRQFYTGWWKDSTGSEHADGWAQAAKQSGIYARAVLIAPRELKYTARLYRELVRIADSVNDEELDVTSLRLLFPHTPVDPAPASDNGPKAELPTTATSPSQESAEDPVAEFGHLNREQQRACRLGLSQNLSVVTGPPGTGKSRVVAHVMANQALDGKPTVFASRNHQAIEAVEPHLNALVEPRTLVVRLSRPFGEGGEDGLLTFFTDLLTRPRPAGAADRYAQGRSFLSESLVRYRELNSRTQRTFELMEALDTALQRFDQLCWDRPGDEVSVIRTVPTTPSVTEIGRTLEDLRRHLGKRRRWWNAIAAMMIPSRARRIQRDSLLLDARFRQCFPMARNHNWESTDDVGMLSVLENWLQIAQAIEAAASCKTFRDRLDALPGLPALYTRLGQCRQQLHDRTLKALELSADARGASLEPTERERMAEMWAGVQNHRGRLGTGRSLKFERALRSSFPSLLKHMPLWATTNLSAGRDLPLSPGAFDLLVVDEASQCDIASVVPLLFRSRRILVVGDPMQLSHVSTINHDLDWRLRQDGGLTDARFERYTHRVNSFFQLAATSRNLGQSTQLTDHHRSHPDIARYCNEAFYAKTLRIVTSTEGLKFPRGSAGGFRWTQVPADVVAAAGGGAISEGEITAIVSELQRLAADRFPGTVGVVTPFRPQANRIRDRVHALMGEQLPAQWRFHVDTADGFQGDERDVILMSLVGGEGLPRGGLWFLRNSPNRFNVAVSRAKAVLHIFGDENWARNCGIPHIEYLWKSAQKLAASGPAREDLIGPVWEPKFADALRREGLQFLQQYQACGRYLDFALLRDGLKLDVEIDGEEHHRDDDGRRKIDDLRRDLVLIAGGWKIQRFWVYELREDMAGCVRKVRELFQAPNGGSEVPS